MTFNLAQPAVTLCIVASGLFFLTGLLGGVWKFWHHANSPDASSPVYVDLAHRASLLYSFASLLLAVFASLSAWSNAVNFYAAAAALAFFAFAVFTYILHGALRDTDNQLKRPHRIGSILLPRHANLVGMVTLIVAEIGGFLVLFTGALKTLG